jgi:hypothetical protein
VLSACTAMLRASASNQALSCSGASADMSQHAWSTPEHQISLPHHQHVARKLSNTGAGRLPTDISSISSSAARFCVSLSFILLRHVRNLSFLISRASDAKGLGGTPSACTRGAAIPRLRTSPPSPPQRVGR